MACSWRDKHIINTLVHDVVNLLYQQNVWEKNIKLIQTNFTLSNVRLRFTLQKLPSFTNLSGIYLTIQLIYLKTCFEININTNYHTNTNFNFKLMIYVFLKRSSVTVSLAMVFHWLLRKLKLLSFKNRLLSSTWSWNQYWRKK